MPGGEKERSQKDAFQLRNCVKVEVAVRWAFRPYEPCGFCGREAATLNHAHAALVTVDPNMSTDIRGHD